VAKHINRKELKRPDQFVSFWTHLSERLQRSLVDRKKPVLLGIGVLAGVVTATLILAELREHTAVRSSQALARVERIAVADLAPADGAAPKDDGVPHFKTDKERLEAALNEVDGFLAAERHSPLRPEAQLQKAGFLLDLQRPDEAIPIYKELVSARLEPNLRFLADEGLGYAYEAKGDLDDALAAFTKLGADAGQKGAAGPGDAGFYQDRALYHQARIAARKGNPTEAAKLYRQVLEKSPQSGLRDEISNRLAVLEQK
jgi:tetratricopeptide (TPR) repeat protein